MLVGGAGVAAGVYSLSPRPMLLCEAGEPEFPLKAMPVRRSVSHTTGHIKTVEGIFANEGADQPLEGSWAKVTYANGDIYQGQLSDNKPQGYGYMIYASGHRYCGDWYKGLHWGKGTFKHSSGDVYVGRFVNDNRDGQGVCVFLGGSVYEGGWKNDELHGKGVFRYSTGGFWQGPFVEGKPEAVRGNSCYYQYGDGNLYLGGFKDDKKHGWGVYKWAVPEGVDRMCTYTGFHANDKRHGEGSLVFNDGKSIYKGWFVDDLFHGHGEEQEMDSAGKLKTVKVGVWKKGVFMGK